MDRERVGIARVDRLVRRLPLEPRSRPTREGPDGPLAGLAFGLSRALPLDVTGRVAALAATYAIEKKGCQEHAFTRQGFLSRYAESFGNAPELGAALI